MRGDASRVGQKGWKAFPSSTFLQCVWSHTSNSKCQTQQAVVAQLRLCSTWYIRTTVWTEACPAATHWCSHCADRDSCWLQTHSACCLLVCTVIYISGRVSPTSSFFHCMCTAWVSWQLSAPNYLLPPVSETETGLKQALFWNMAKFWGFLVPKWFELWQ